MTPRVSIVLPTYNRLAFLREAVESVRAQTMTDWELIVVDDGSTDDTIAWLESLDDRRIFCVRTRHTGNKSLLRNLGVAHAQADWIAFLDSDDMWVPQKLTRQLEQLAANPSCRWSCTAVEFIDADGAPAVQRAGTPYRAQSGWILEALLMFTAAATMPTLMVQRALLAEVHGFNESFLLREDYELELRLAAHSEILALTEALTVVRDHPGRTSSSRRVAELHRGTELVFRDVARWTADERCRTICRRQWSWQLVYRARTLLRDGERLAAIASALRAVRDRPLEYGIWRAATGCVLRAVLPGRPHDRSLIGRSSEHRG